MKKRTVSDRPWATPNPTGFNWKHDETGERFDFHGEVGGLYPQYSMLWTEGEFGAYTFIEDGTGEEFSITPGVRGIGFRAVIAFDSLGKGLIFSK